jgi:hypothetical protein
MKGFLYIFEAVLAGIIIVGFLAVLAAFPESRDTGANAYEILRGLDEQGVLRTYAVGGDYSGLNSIISTPGFSHSVQICSRSGCSGSAPASHTVFTGSYFVAGKDSYSPALVRLYLW